jgi:hypothetical protein
MDLLYFFKTRLEFIEQLYDSVVIPFEEVKRKIDAGEAPYVDHRDPEYVDEPAFLEEWQQADDSIMVVGQWCLCMVQMALKAFLKECIGPAGSVWWRTMRLHEALLKKKGDWFVRYKALFLDELGIDWDRGPVPLGELEQLNLTRNDLIHNMDMFSMSIERDEAHAKKFPTGLFTDGGWFGLKFDRVRIDRAKLQLAIALVAEFCGWLDGVRCSYPK